MGIENGIPYRFSFVFPGAWVLHIIELFEPFPQLAHCIPRTAALALTLRALRVGYRYMTQSRPLPPVLDTCGFLPPLSSGFALVSLPQRNTGQLVWIVQT